MARAVSSGGQSGARSSGKAWLGVVAFAAAVILFNLHALRGGSGLMSAEAPAVATTFVGECISAETLARAGQALPEISSDLRKTCDAAFNRGKPTEAMLAVREGRAVARAGPTTEGGF